MEVEEQHFVGETSALSKRVTFSLFGLAAVAVVVVAITVAFSVVLSQQGKEANTRAASVKALEIAVNGENTNGQDTGLRHRVDALEACCASMKLSVAAAANTANAAMTVAETVAITTDVVQMGTFTWAMAGNAYTIAQTCGGSRGVWLDWSIVNGGTGYALGTLIVVRDDDNTDIQFNPVLRVSAVDSVTGAVTAFQTLTVGCANALYATQRGPFNTFASGASPGSGLTVRSSGSTTTMPANNAYYAYPTPLDNLLAPLQESAYRVKHIHIGNDMVFTVLELDPPPVPMRSVGVTGRTFMQVAAYNFDPPVNEFRSLAIAHANGQLAVQNREAFSLSDNSNCMDNGQCYLTGILQGIQSTSGTLGFSQIRNTAPLGKDWHIYEYLEFHFYSQDGTFNFGAADVEFTLTKPVKLTLPTV